MTYSKLRFQKIKNFVSRSPFGELQLTQISLNFQTFCRNLKIKGMFSKVRAHITVVFFFDLYQNFMDSCYPRQNFGSRLPHHFFFDPYHLRINLAHAIHEAARTMPPVLPEPAALFGVLTRRRRAEARVSGKLRLQGGQA